MSKATQFSTAEQGAFSVPSDMGIGAADVVTLHVPATKGVLDPRKDYLSAVRGIMLGLALSIPAWLLVGLAIYAIVH